MTTTMNKNTEELNLKEMGTIAAGKIELTPELHYYLYSELVQYRAQGYDLNRAICNVVGNIVGFTNRDFDDLVEVIKIVWNNLDDRQTRVYHRSCWEQ